MSESRLPDLPHYLLTFDIWLNAVDRHPLQALTARPAPDAWSLGEVIIHLIDQTHFFYDQADACLLDDEHAEADMTETGRAMFVAGAFPNENIRTPAAAAAKVRQPVSKQELSDALRALREQARRLAHRLATTSSKGKVRHPGLGYFNASEWFRFADMHLRHHLRQMEKIEVFLAVANNIPDDRLRPCI